MAQTVLITLTTAGTDTGPFDLYSNVDGFTTPFENNVSKASLQAGYTSVVVPDGATTIRVQSDNVTCDNFIDLTIVTTTTTTSSTTTTTSSTTTTTTSSTTTTTTSTSSTTTTTTTAYCTEGCLQYRATGEGSPSTLFWYITCEGVYTEQTINLNDEFEFCACDKPNQYSTTDVTITPLGACP